MEKEYWYDASLKKRYKFQNKFKRIGYSALLFILGLIVSLVVTISYTGSGALKATKIALDVKLDDDKDPSEIVKDYLYGKFNPSNRKERKYVNALITDDAETQVEKIIKENPLWEGSTVRVWTMASSLVDLYQKGDLSRTTPEHERKLKNIQMNWIDELKLTEQIRIDFNTGFFTNSDSAEPTSAGVLGAIIGSLLTLLICISLSLPIGVLSAIYLEEFATRNKFTDWLEVFINNLAAVPSIIFGLLGLSIFISIMGMPRSAPITGGAVLALMSLPTIVIATRAALKSIPQSIRDAALGLGASKHQAVFHHVLPQALPSIATGTIIAMAQALGETAPLIMIGMIAFIADVNGSILEPASTLPTQIFLWADHAERSFTEKTSALIMVLLCILFIMNGIAAWLRHKFEKNT